MIKWEWGIKMKNEKIHIPQIDGSLFAIDIDNEIVTINFFNGNGDNLDNENIIAQLSLPFDEYLDFAMSFISAGIKAEQDFGIKLGFDLSVKFDKEV